MQARGWMATDSRPVAIPTPGGDDMADLVVLGFLSRRSGVVVRCETNCHWGGKSGLLGASEQCVAR
jgi:hypothetical protein